ncbi:MAG: heavy-metal-associated domain-containing protein [Flavobacteriales bacterium]|nr:heavy-metal-associated domain-containing protein [Flavobacteriales bacterium]
MRVINRVFILLFIVTVVSSCGNNEEQKEEEVSIEVSTENLTIADYTIEGMVCAMGCAATIEKDVVGMTGVVVSEVNYETGKAHFEFDQAIVSENEIIAKIESIADGQYKVEEWSDENNSEEELETVEDEVETVEDEIAESNEETIVEVSLPSFEIPNLFTLLMDQI